MQYPPGDQGLIRNTELAGQYQEQAFLSYQVLPQLGTGCIRYQHSPQRWRLLDSVLGHRAQRPDCRVPIQKVSRISIKIHSSQPDLYRQQH